MNHHLTIQTNLIQILRLINEQLAYILVLYPDNDDRDKWRVGDNWKFHIGTPISYIEGTYFLYMLPLRVTRTILLSNTYLSRRHFVLFG